MGGGVLEVILGCVRPKSECCDLDQSKSGQDHLTRFQFSMSVGRPRALWVTYGYLRDASRTPG
ncbi:hypothetical protein SuNHUV7_09250 (plasmid) [Pseudoseohaeicola sp. NH-UV-7]